MVLSLHPVAADQPVVVGPDGNSIAIPVQPGRSGRLRGDKPETGTPADAKPADDAAKTAEVANDAKKDSPEPKVIRRDEAKDGESNPDELKATVGDDGKVAFQFRNQPWVELGPMVGRNLGSAARLVGTSRRSSQHAIAWPLYRCRSTRSVQSSPAGPRLYAAGSRRRFDGCEDGEHQSGNRAARRCR